MTANDQRPFTQWLTLLAESFNRSLSTLLFETYWHCLKPYSFAQVRQAMLSYLKNPDNSKKGLPTPPDLIALIVGDSRTYALQAWTSVVKSMRSIGQYESVVFDDPIIHQVITDMGGWIYLCRQPEKELSFLRHEFEKRYRDYFGGVLPSPPPYLKGRIEHQNEVHGFEHNKSKPVLIGGASRPLTRYSLPDQIPSTSHEASFPKTQKMAREATVKNTHVTDQESDKNSFVWANQVL